MSDLARQRTRKENDGEGTGRECLRVKESKLLQTLRTEAETPVKIWSVPCSRLGTTSGCLSFGFKRDEDLFHLLFFFLRIDVHFVRPCILGIRRIDCWKFSIISIDIAIALKSLVGFRRTLRRSCSERWWFPKSPKDTSPENGSRTVYRYVGKPLTHYAVYHIPESWICTLNPNSENSRGKMIRILVFG